MEEAAEWTVVGKKAGKKCRSKVLSLKAAEALNQAHQGVWAPGVVLEGVDGTHSSDLNTPTHARGRKRHLQNKPPLDRYEIASDRYEIASDTIAILSNLV